VRSEAQRAAAVVFSLVVVSGCATSQKTVDMKDARRVVGTENEVRVDAEVYGDRLSTSTTLPIKYDITNQRSQSILVADIVPDATYDDETQMVTISIGSEVPGNIMVPRLIAIAPGEKKTFNTAAHVAIAASSANSPWVRHPNAVRIRVNFLGDATPFQQLIAIKETAIVSKDRRQRDRDDECPPHGLGGCTQRRLQCRQPRPAATGKTRWAYRRLSLTHRSVNVTTLPERDLRCLGASSRSRSASCVALHAVYVTWSVIYVLGVYRRVRAHAN